MPRFPLRQAHLLGLALILLAALSSSCSTTKPLVEIPQVVVPPAPVPAECRKSSFVAFDDGLPGLPLDYQQLSKAQRARVLLNNEVTNTRTYRTLRSQAIRCAPLK